MIDKQIDTTKQTSIYQVLKETQITQLLYCLALVVWISDQILLRVLSGGFFSKYTFAVRLFTASLLLIAELTSGRYSLTTFTGLILLTLITIVGEKNNIVYLPDLIMFIYVGRLLDYRTILYCTGYTCLSVLLVIVALSQLGLITDYISTGTRIRHYLGFIYPLYPAKLAFNITCASFARSDKPLSWKTLAGLSFLNCYIYFLTQSRLSFYLSILLIAVAQLALIMRWNGQGRFGLLLSLSFIVAACVAIGMTLSYDGFNPILTSIDTMLDHRLRLGKSAIETYGIHLTGTKIQLVGHGLNQQGVDSSLSRIYNYIDSAYVQLLLRQGWISLLIFVVAMTLLCLEMRRRGNGSCLIVLSIIAVHAIIDDSTINLATNSLLLLLSTLLL